LIILKNFFHDDYEFLRNNLDRNRKNSLLNLLNGNSNLIKIILDRQITLDDVETVQKDINRFIKKILE